MGFRLASPDQRLGLAAFPIITPASLEVLSWVNTPMIIENSPFHFYAAIFNSGYTAAGSYFLLSVPDGFTLEGVDIYTDDGRSHYYPSSELYYLGGFWRIAVGETISGHPRLIRMTVVANSGIGLGDYTFMAGAYYHEGGNLQSATNTSYTTVTVVPPSYVYLPLIVR